MERQEDGSGLRLLHRICKQGGRIGSQATDQPVIELGRRRSRRGRFAADHPLRPPQPRKFFMNPWGTFTLQIEEVRRGAEHSWPGIHPHECLDRKLGSTAQKVRRPGAEHSRGAAPEPPRARGVATRAARQAIGVDRQGAQAGSLRCDLMTKPAPPFDVRRGRSGHEPHHPGGPQGSEQEERSATRVRHSPPLLAVKHEARVDA